MFDIYNNLVLNVCASLKLCEILNERILREVNKAHSGLSSVGFKHKPSLKEFRLLPPHQNLAPVWAFSISTCHVESYGSNALYQCGKSLKGNQKAKRGSEIFRALIGDCIKLISLNKLQQIHDCNTQSRNMAPKGMLGLSVGVALPKISTITKGDI